MSRRLRDVPLAFLVRGVNVESASAGEGAPPEDPWPLRGCLKVLLFPLFILLGIAGGMYVAPDIAGLWVRIFGTGHEDDYPPPEDAPKP